MPKFVGEAFWEGNYWQQKVPGGGVGYGRNEGRLVWLMGEINTVGKSRRVLWLR